MNCIWNRNQIKDMFNCIFDNYKYIIDFNYLCPPYNMASLSVYDLYGNKILILNFFLDSNKVYISNTEKEIEFNFDSLNYLNLLIKTKIEFNFNLPLEIYKDFLEYCKMYNVKGL